MTDSNSNSSEPADRELTANELDVAGMVDSMHFRVGGAWAVLGEKTTRAHEVRERLWDLIPFLKALGRLALEHPERARLLWADALREPMPCGAPPVGMPRRPTPTSSQT